MHAHWSLYLYVTGIYACPLVHVLLCNWHIYTGPSTSVSHYISTSPSTSVSLEYKYPLVQVPLYHLHMPTGPCTAVSLAYIYNHWSMHFCVTGIIYPLIHVPLCQWHVFLGPHTSMSVAFLVAWHLTDTRRCSCSMAYAWNGVHHMSGC